MDLNKTILTTEDGKPMKEGDDCWMIRDLNEEPIKTKIYDYTHELILQKGLKYLYFSTRQNADEYVFLNRKVYSRKELAEILKNKK